MSLAPGSRIWIPCEVKPGPFPDERMVLVASDGAEWFGYVNVRHLRDGVQEGRDAVMATIVEVRGDTFTARIRGHTPASSLFQGLTERVVSGGSLEA